MTTPTIPEFDASNTVFYDDSTDSQYFHEHFNPDEYLYVKCTSAYDGDTCSVDCYLRIDEKTGKFTQVVDESGVIPHIYKLKLRLAEINAPEIRTRDAIEKERGLKSRDYLRSRILGKIIRIRVKDKLDKYGRNIAWLYDGDENLNDTMVTRNHAVYKKY